jgi:diacylglycerol kinase family enzyme
VHRRGREAVVAAEEPLRFQIDGDRPEPADPVTRLVTQLSPAALRVLLP